MAKGNWVEFEETPLTNPPEANASKKAKATRNVRVTRVRNNKGGKTVTAISGLELSTKESILLLKKLKARLGTGGTIKDGCIEIQGDKVDIILQLLKVEGYRPKQSGS